MIAFQAHRNDVQALAFSPNGQAIASAARDRVCAWSVGGFKMIHEFPPSGLWSAKSIAYSPNGEFFARGGHRGTVVWSMTPRVKEIGSFRNLLQSLEFSPDGKILAGYEGYGLRRWSMPDGAACSNAGSWRNPTSTILPAGSLSFSPDGQLLAILTAEWQKKDFQPVVYLRTTTTGKIVARISTDAFKDLYRHPPVLRFSPDCRFLAGLSSTSLCIWEMNHAAEAARIKGKKHFKDCVFLPDGRRLVTVSNDALVRVWRTDCWTETDAYEWKIGKLACVAVSPDGCLLAAGGSTGKIVLWDAV